LSTGATPIDDPNVKIPAAIKATAAKADEIHRAAYPKEPAPADPQQDQPKDPAKQADPPADPSQDQPKPAEPAPAEPKDQNWEHAYKSMKGRFDSQKDTVRSLTDQLAALRYELNELRSRPAATAPAATPEPLLTDQEVADYGKDFLDVVGKKAKEALSAEVVELRQQVADLKTMLSGTVKSVAMNARDRMKASLSETVPNWEEINERSDFLDWLSLQDPFSGAIRHELLKQAWAANKTAQVLAFFKGFLAQEAAVAPQPDPRPDPQYGKVPLETFAAPGRAKSAADSPASPAEKPIFTPAQVSQFYTQKAAGSYRGREDEANLLEQQIIAAGREGRIRNR
jgi:hypothetical protein